MVSNFFWNFTLELIFNFFALAAPPVAFLAVKNFYRKSLSRDRKPACRGQGRPACGMAGAKYARETSHSKSLFVVIKSKQF
ncbi:MAG: hypothetical protein EA392_12070 [Cryomorphaceae bacterium]|nr:MAG: hypothetical protein EA392_12070 [Cryomorphaceae bacterium]